MCGIAGVFEFGDSPRHSPVMAVSRALSAMRHRGPDGSNVLHWGHEHSPRIQEPHEGDPISSRHALGHNRLAILDPSPRAAQPMRSRTAHTWIAFNGEIYNFKDLRERFSNDFPWRTNSDSEVLVESVESFGSAIIPHLNGMFAFATLDVRAETLLVARDRLGIKPLYYYHIPRRVFAIASEIKAFLAFNLFRANLNERSLREYLTFQNSLTGETLLEGVSEFPAGSYAQIDLRKGTMTLSRYWAPPRFSPSFSSLESAAEATANTLSRVIDRQLVADVPLGSFLSGGLDSSAVTSFASARRSPLPSFTCGFEIDSKDSEGVLCDETAAANSIALALKTEHHTLRLDMTSWSQTLPSWIWHLDDLRVGMSIQNFMLCDEVSKHVRVVLSGTGGDELFGGYPWRYDPLLRCESIGEEVARAYEWWQRLLPSRQHHTLFSDDVLSRTADLRLEEIFKATWTTSEGQTPLERALDFDLTTFLRGLLIVEDRSSMAHGLESRVPLLDNELLDLTRRLPNSLLYDPTHGSKVVLREALKGRIPEEIRVGRKQGFVPPQAAWMRSAGDAMFKDLLCSERCLERGIFKREWLTTLFDDPGHHSKSHQALKWSLVCCELWLRAFIDGQQPDY